MVKPISILLKQETVSSSGISWAICMSALRFRQIATPVPDTHFFTGWMPFLPPNQQRQCTEGIQYSTVTHTHTRLTALCPGLPRWAGARKVKRIWILLEQETMSGSGISWAICISTHRSRQITTPAPHHSVFYRLDALPAAQPTASKH